MQLIKIPINISYKLLPLLLGLCLYSPLVLADNNPTIESVTVIAKSMPDSIELEAKVEAINQAVITAQVAGTINALKVQAGDQVHIGQELLAIERDIPEQSSKAAQAQAQQAQAQLELAQAQLQRQAMLYKQNFISKAAYDQAVAEFKTAKANTNASLAQAKAADFTSNHYLIKAPFNGVISKLPVNVGDLAIAGKALATVYDPKALRLKVMLPQSYAKHIKNHAEIIWPTQQKDLPDMLPYQVIPDVNSNLNLEIRINLPANTDNLLPGTPIKVRLSLDTEKQVLLVPNSAVVDYAGVAGVYVLNQDLTSSFRKVKTGKHQSGYTEILSGLQPGEQIIAKPIQPGTRNE